MSGCEYSEFMDVVDAIINFVVVCPGPHLPLSCLRFLVPPIRLVSAAIWQKIEQKVVADYGLLEEFVFMVTEVVPQLLTTKQRAELILGLRARVRKRLISCLKTGEK